METGLATDDGEGPRAEAAPALLRLVLPALALVAVAAQVFALPSFGLTIEDHRWQRVFAQVFTEGEIFLRAIGTYRPLCGLLLVCEDGLGLGIASKFGLLWFVYYLNLSLWGLLVARVLDRRAAVLGAFVALCWSTSDELVSSLSSRCDGLVALTSLLASHAYLQAHRSPQRRWLFAWLAAAAVCLACLSKETGFALPLLWLLFGWPLGVRARRTALPALWAAVAIFALRSAVSGGLGSYVSSYVEAGPSHWAAQTLKTLGSLLLGHGPAAGPALYASAAVATAGLLALMTAALPKAARPRTVGALLLLLGPLALLFSSRATYPVVLLLSAWVGHLACTRGRTPAVAAAIGLFVAWQTASSVWSSTRWTQAYRTRARAIATLQERVSAGQLILLLAPRQHFAGRHMGPIVSAELSDGRRIASACRKQRGRPAQPWRAFAPPADTLLLDAAPTVPVHVRALGNCRYALSLDVGRCGAVTGLGHSQLSSTDRGFVLSLDPRDLPLTLVHRGDLGATHFEHVSRCEPTR